MSYPLRRSHKKAIALYKEAFGEIENDAEFLLLRPCEAGVVIIKALESTTAKAFHLQDQVLVSQGKIYRNYEQVYPTKNGEENE